MERCVDGHLQIEVVAVHVTSRHICFVRYIRGVEEIVSVDVKYLATFRQLIGMGEFRDFIDWCEDWFEWLRRGWFYHGFDINHYCFLHFSICMLQYTNCRQATIAAVFFFSDAMNARMSTMHTTMNAAPMFMDFHGLVIPVIAPSAANAYGGMKEPTELPKNA